MVNISHVRFIIEPELLISLYYGNQYTQIEISEILGCSIETISRNMKNYNIPTVNKGKIKKGEHKSVLTEFKNGNRNLYKGMSLPWSQREKHWNWHGGRTKEYRRRNNIEYKIWRNSVFERDNYTCQICHKYGCELNAHHIKQFSKYPSLRYDIDNGISLCKECHYNIHRGG